MEEPPVHTGAGEVHAHARKTGHRWVDMAVAFSAIAISVISLFVAIEHGETEKKLVAANSWPFLVYASTQSGLERGSRLLDLRVENSGVGPARIQTVTMTLDGRAVRNHSELLRLCCNMPASDDFTLVSKGLVDENPIVGVLPARAGVDFLAVRERPGNAEMWTALNGARRRLELSACYCSVLDECWTTDLRSTTTPKPVKRCLPNVNAYME